MLFDKLSGKIDQFEFEGENCTFDGKKVSIRDASFLSYYFLRDGREDKTAMFINYASNAIIDGSAGYIERVLWLFVLGEYINKTKKTVFMNKLTSVVELLLDDISLKWQKPLANWICPSDDGVYLSNIALSYGAVQSINNSLRSDKAEKLLLSIKGFMFKKFLCGGKVVSKLGSSEILGDIGAIAVPFGLLDAGNQILVESINVMENELVTGGVRYSASDTYYGGCIRNDLTCLLSWYYSERGDIARAKWLLDKVAAVWDRDGSLFEADSASRKEDIYYNYWVQKNGNIKESYLSYILFAIADQNIEIKERQGAAAGTGKLLIIHNPSGLSNPYRAENYERYPGNPEVNDNVQLKAVTQPFDINQKVYVKYSVNNIEKEKLKMKLCVSQDGEKFWQADIGCFNFGDRVEYKFEVKYNSTVTKSILYAFDVRKWQSPGKVINVSCDKDNISIFFEKLLKSNKNPCLSIEKYSGNTVKCSFSMKNTDDIPESSFSGINNLSFKLDDYKLEASIKDMIIKKMGKNQKKILEAYINHGESFIEFLTDSNGHVYKIRYKFLMNPDERFFGMGERYSKIEYRGLDIDNYVYNQYRDQGLKTYMPVPFTMSTNGYGIYLDTARYSVFRFGTRLSDMFEIEENLGIQDQQSTLYMFFGSPKENLQEFAKITGKPDLPPKWAFGPWMSSNNWDRQTEIYKQVELTKKYEIPSTVLVIEQWSDEATFYIFNDAQYKVKDGNDYLKYEDYKFPDWGRWPDPKKMVEDIHKEGLRLLLWQAPVEKFMDGITHEQRDEDEKAMIENGYYIKHKNGEAYHVPSYEWFKGSLIPDFTNPEARKWWFNKRLYLVKDIGIDGFKTDGGECLYGDDLEPSDGTCGDEARNKYPNIYIGSYNEFIKKYTKGNGITFSRSGYTGSQKMPLHWAGDERSTFAAFRSSIRAGLSCSMSGIPFWGWDLAGFNGKIPTAELYVRAAQMAAFCPVMQYHAETKGEYNQDRTPWNIAQRTGEPYVIDIYRKYAQLRMNILPYIYHEAILSCQTGIPMMRSMFLEYPEDTSSQGLTGQYFFGESMLVAPVTEEGSSVKNIYFPGGKWMDFFTGKVVPGNRYLTVKADITHIPVYIKENSIIPLNLTDEYKLGSSAGNAVDRYNNLCFLVYAGSEVNYNFEDDLGNALFISSKVCSSKLYVDIKFKSTAEKSIALIIKNNKGKAKVSSDSNDLAEVNDIKSMDCGKYINDGGYLLIKLYSKDTKIVIEEN